MLKGKRETIEVLLQTSNTFTAFRLTNLLLGNNIVLIMVKDFLYSKIRTLVCVGNNKQAMSHPHLQNNLKLNTCA